MATATHSRNASHSFNPVDTSFQPASKDDVESPSLSHPSCLARFEFESGQRNGTKILMLEWEDDATTREVPGAWHISWEGKNTVLSAADAEAGAMHRMYFMLPPDVSVPSIVTLTHKPQDASRSAVTWQTNPLPAIFPPELGASARAAGKKGVLHTIWAKKRLQELQREIDAESKANVEGVALTMVIQEKEWIEQNFGVTARPTHLKLGLPQAGGGLTTGEGLPISPMTPRTPGGGRLMEKLRGLKLGTTDRELSPSVEPSFDSNPLSPETSDVAISSFAAFKGANPSILAAKPPQPPSLSSPPIQQQQPPRKITGQDPPAAIVAQQLQAEHVGSLNAIALPAATSQNTPHAFTTAAASDQTRIPQPPLPAAMTTIQDEEGLFALPISPRSPEMTKSPFSFKTSDTQRYMKKETA